MNFYNLFSSFNILLSKVIDGTALDSAPAVVADVADASVAAPQAPVDLMAMIPTLAIYGVFIFALYWFLFRQPRKEQKVKNEMRSSLKIGDTVLTASGFYGKIVDIGVDVFVIELGNNRSVRVPVKKEAIEAASEPILNFTPEPSSTKK